MKYYEIREMNHPVSEGYRARTIDEDELKRRIDQFRRVENITYDECRQILLYGKVKEAPDPWEEWAEELTWACFDGDDKKIKAGLLKLKTLVEKKD